MSAVGVVIIGRNEGERLVRCLLSVRQSVRPDARIVYVDSGSSDGSVAAAAGAGAIVVDLDMTRPFTAARARNAGRAALPAACGYIQFVDGDCMLQPDWLARAAAALDADDGLAAVFGRRREVAPAASLYNWLCDIEWAVAPGPARYFGGDVMIRAAALDQAGGYPAEMIAGEEPDLAMRLRKRGWRLECVAGEMTLHDAAIRYFGQWWRRTTRSGHAYAELAARHGGKGYSDYRRRLVGVFGLGCLPFVGGLLLVAGLSFAGPSWAGAGAILLALPVIQYVRLVVKGWRQRPLSEAAAIAAFLLAAKPAQALGAGRYAMARLTGKRSALIEYKEGVA